MKKKPASRTHMKPRISISPEYSGIVPKLSGAEYEALKQSIKDDGQLLPIIVNEEGVILDGHHRYKACLELGLELKTARTEFNTKNEEMLFVINTNLNRRQLNSYKRAVLALKKKPLLAKTAKENIRQAKVSRIRETLHVDERLAKDAGVSKEVLYRVERIEKQGSEELKELASSGQLSINRAYALIGKDVDTILAFDNLQKTFDKIAESFSKIPPGSEQEQAAKRYIKNFGHAVESIDSIPVEDWENGNALRMLAGALFGGEDGMVAAQFFAMSGDRMPPELVCPAYDLDESEKAVFLSAAEKMKKYPPYMVTFSSQERTLLSRMTERIASNVRGYLGANA